MVEMLLKHGADANAQADGSNPLLEAAHRGHMKILKLLLAAGAKVSACPHWKTVCVAYMGRHWLVFMHNPHFYFSSNMSDLLTFISS